MERPKQKSSPDEVFGKGRKELAGSRTRVPCAEIETVILNALRGHAPASALSDRAVIEAYVERVSLGQNNIKIDLKTSDAQINVPWLLIPKRPLATIEKKLG